MKHILMLVAVGVMMLGCARDPTLPPANVDGEFPEIIRSSSEIWDGPYQNWGEWTFYIDESHTQIDVVPKRQGRFHLNALKFLEEYCPDCLEIVGLHNNGDGTIDLTIRITHPFPGMPQYTAFDMKGIVMFQGSYEFPLENPAWHLPTPYFRISWWNMGDPELLNPDGYTPRWSPNWDSGSNMPIFNYWEGKFASGVPTADLNAYLDFYTNEERHMFQTDSQVQRTYTIWLPPGPVTVGYAVEACWEPPTVTPVTDPVEDFPISANQPEAYYFRHVVNMGEEITDCAEWDIPLTDCTRIYIDIAQWGGITSDRYMRFEPDGGGNGGGIGQCDPPVEGRFEVHHMDACEDGNGTHRGVCFNYYYNMGYRIDIAYTVFDWTVNDPNI